MILDAIFAVVLGVIELVVGLFASLVPDVPAFFVNALDDVEPVMAYVRGFSTWLPVGLLMTVLGAVLAAWVAAIVIGGIRWVVSYFLGGGGTT